MKKIIILLGILFFFTACQYEFIELYTPPPIDPTADVSFANEIVPIFTTDDYCTSCHDVGEKPPDLSAANAYQSLVNGGYVVSNDPEGSLIYTYCKPGATTHVWDSYDNYQAELVFTWITQGAKDN